MVGLYLIDSSFLISLAKIKRTELLKQEKLKGHLVTLQEVYLETVVDGVNFGYQDAYLIKELFDQKVLRFSHLPLEIKNIPKVDDRLVWLLRNQKEIKYGYVDDEKLGNKMKLIGKAILTSIDFLTEAFSEGLLPKEELVKAIFDLQSTSRITEEALKRALSILNQRR